jgi:hypothetical protein
VGVLWQRPFGDRDRGSGVPLAESVRAAPLMPTGRLTYDAAPERAGALGGEHQGRPAIALGLVQDQEPAG